MLSHIRISLRGSDFAFVLYALAIAAMALVGCDGRTSEVNNLDFADPILRTRWEALDAKAQAVSEKSWARDKYHKPPISPLGYRAHWSTAVDAQGQPAAKRDRSDQEL